MWKSFSDCRQSLSFRPTQGGVVAQLSWSADFLAIGEALSQTLWDRDARAFSTRFVSSRDVPPMRHVLGMGSAPRRQTREGAPRDTPLDGVARQEMARLE